MVPTDPPRRYNNATLCTGWTMGTGYGSKNDWQGGSGIAKGCEGARKGKIAYCFPGGAPGGASELECPVERSPNCLGLPANGGRSDKHGAFRPGPGLVFGVGRFYDALPYGHLTQVITCQCGPCNKWEIRLLFADVKPFGWSRRSSV
jgi:hypothetical protein